jgi:alkanesulfonate monooxygenase
VDFRFGGRPVRVFTISPRTVDPRQYWDDIVNVADWSEQHGCTGVLLFTGNDVLVDPWVASQAVLARTRRIAPLVAVNPIYMHPFAAAKTLMSLSRLYGRKLYVNLVTGTAVNYLESLGDDLSHDDRYARLLEYATVIRRLLSSTRPLTWCGRFYRIQGAQALPGVSADLMPEFVLAGQSPAARAVCRELDAVWMQMLPSNLADGLDGARGVHFGIVTRADEREAWRAATALFPESEENRQVLDLSMQNTDSAWKRALHADASAAEASADGYWLGAFRNFGADGPYLVGSHRRVADVILSLTRRGVDTFIVDVPARFEEFRETAAAFALAAVDAAAAVSAPHSALRSEDRL